MRDNEDNITREELKSVQKSIALFKQDIRKIVREELTSASLNAWIQGYYSNGLAIIPGKIWRGPYAGKYLVAIDFDNRKAVEEFCRNNLERLKQTTLVEQTSNPDKMHIYFIVEREIPNKASDKTNTITLAKI